MEAAIVVVNHYWSDLWRDELNVPAMPEIYANAGIDGRSPAMYTGRKLGKPAESQGEGAMAMTVRYTVLDGETMSENRGGVIRDYLPDALGNTIALLDSSQTKTDTFSYYPYLRHEVA
jgi:hypothetical protein